MILQSTPLPTTDQSLLWGLLPSTWGTKKLSAVAIEDSKQVKPSNYATQTYNYWGLDAIDRDQFQEPAPNYVSGSTIDSTCVVFDESHVLYSKLRPYLNKVIVPSLGGIGTTEWIVIQPNQALITRKYLAYMLRTKTFIQYATKNSTGARMPRMRKEALWSFDVPLPYSDDPNKSLQVQRAIVARIESLLAETREIDDLLEKIRFDSGLLLESAFDEVYQRLRTTSETLLLGEVATADNGKASGQGESDIRVFKTKHVYPHSLRMTQPSYAKPDQIKSIPTNKFLREGDVLMANIAEGTLGRLTFVEAVEPQWTVDTQIMILRTKNPDVLLSKWLYYYLSSKYGQKEIMMKRSGIAFAEKRGQTHIYPKDVRNIPVLLPGIKSQIQVVSYLDAILTEAQEIQQQVAIDIQNIRQVQQGILEQAFRGEL